MVGFYWATFCLCSTTSEADSQESKVGERSLEPKGPAVVVAAGTTDTVASMPNTVAVDSSTAAGSTVQNSE